LAEDLLAHHRDAKDLPKEIDHLLGPGQTAQVPVNDDAVEAVIHQGQQIREQLDEPFHVHAIYSMERKLWAAEPSNVGRLDRCWTVRASALPTRLHISKTRLPITTDGLSASANSSYSPPTLVMPGCSTS